MPRQLAQRAQRGRQRRATAIRLLACRLARLRPLMLVTLYLWGKGSEHRVRPARPATCMLARHCRRRKLWCTAWEAPPCCCTAGRTLPAARACPSSGCSTMGPRRPTGSNWHGRTTQHLRRSGGLPAGLCDLLLVLLSVCATSAYTGVHACLTAPLRQRVACATIVPPPPALAHPPTTLMQITTTCWHRSRCTWWQGATMASLKRRTST